MAEYNLIENIEKCLWDKCVDNSKEGTIFLKTDFVQSLDLKYKTYFVTQGKEPVAGCIVLLDEHGKFIPSPYPFVPYQGFFFIDNGETSYHKVVSNQFKITEYLINQLIFIYGGLSQTHFNLQDFRPFLWYNYHTPEKGLFKLEMNYTPLLNLCQFNGLNEYLTSIRTVRRQEYKKAKDSGIKIIDSDDVEVLCRLHNLTFQRQGINLDTMEENLTRSISQNAIAKGYGRLQVAMIGERPASAILFLLDKKRGYYMFGANDPEYRKSFASTLLLIENIWRCKMDGLKEVDFVGCNSPNRGDYKLSFNGELRAYFKTELILS
jgi:hypothetical protein